MDLSYASIPNSIHEIVTLHRSPFMRYFIEYITNPYNEVENQTFGKLFNMGNFFLNIEDRLYLEEEGP